MASSIFPSFSAGAPPDATYLTQTSASGLSNEQAVGNLATGLMKVAHTTGIVSAVTDSAGLAGCLSDETGTGAAVFANTPTLVTPVLGAATGTSVNLSGDCTAATYHVGADAGADGTGTVITAITVKKGLITAITVS